MRTWKAGSSDGNGPLKKDEYSDPFKSKPATPRLGGKRKQQSTYDVARLRQRYPSLRGR
jgi:hypothetical protein